MLDNSVNWEMELGNVGTCDGDGDGDGMNPALSTNEAREMIPAIRVFLSVSLKPASPPNPFGSFFNLRRCQDPLHGLHDEQRS